ncbi:MAG: two-component system, OmpR family, phosphate regulon response regulator PhoB [Thermoleophilaceae bacterium]|nr:two-component system, OmpR family, phosphate regulon response regulator PhoB [Thermoleophilaceae bacterium]
MLARVRAVLRRAEGRRTRGVVRVGELTLDPSTRAVRLAGRRIELAAKEFALLQALAEQPTRVYGKQELLRDVWGYLSPGNTRTLDAHACRLRKKLRPSGRPWVVNVRGVGYKLTEAL